MKATAVSLLALFEMKMQLEVPLFQRQYVWQRDRHWEPLWEDVARKFTDYIDGRKDAPIHFLGALVLDLKQTPATHVGKRQVIDGQQRLTTFQVFLAAFRDFCEENGCDDLARECSGYTFNKGMMAEPEIDRFKVWPTQLDRSQFADVITAGSRTELITRYPLKKRPYARTYDPRPRMVEAYLFFYEQLRAFFIGSEEEPPLAMEIPLPARVEECFQALKSALQVVEIDLEQADDAQVIFETLNARGEPLLPADLLRNFIFLRAARRGEPQEALYKQYWASFDEQFWRVEVKQGRLLRPRSDLYLQHFLASRLTVDVPIKSLFAEYKFWIERAQPFSSVRDELACLARQGKDFRRIADPEREDVLYGLATFLEAFDVRTTYPLLLTMLDLGMDQSEWPKVTAVLESYLVRRAVCGLTTKNYNRMFLTLTRNMRRDGASAESLTRHLAGLPGDSTEWPSDARFSEAWMTQHVYHVLNNPKIVHVLRRVSETFHDRKLEGVQITTPLTVEHILPQQWQNQWPLPDGSKGVTAAELLLLQANDPRAVATRRRNAILQTFGNLTIHTQALNASNSNDPWSAKQPKLLRGSYLAINLQLVDVNTWDEAAIEARGRDLLKRAFALWPRPSEVS